MLKIIPKHTTPGLVIEPTYLKYNFFTYRYNKLANILITPASIGAPFDPNKISEPPENVIKPKEFPACWDTGAMKTSISPNVVDDCKLKPISIARVLHGGGTEEVPVFLVSLWLPNKVYIPKLAVNGLNLLGDIKILIGMDVINNGDFAVTNKDQKTVFSFRMPSSAEIDFEADAAYPRNSPCPCGSGKKYKHCHGR